MINVRSTGLFAFIELGWALSSKRSNRLFCSVLESQTTECTKDSHAQVTGCSWVIHLSNTTDHLQRLWRHTSHGQTHEEEVSNMKSLSHRFSWFCLSWPRIWFCLLFPDEFLYNNTVSRPPFSSAFTSTLSCPFSWRWWLGCACRPFALEKCVFFFADSERHPLVTSSSDTLVSFKSESFVTTHISSCVSPAWVHLNCPLLEKHALSSDSKDEREKVMWTYICCWLSQVIRLFTIFVSATKAWEIYFCHVGTGKQTTKHLSSWELYRQPSLRSLPHSSFHRKVVWVSYSRKRASSSKTLVLMSSHLTSIFLQVSLDFLWTTAILLV